MVNLNMGFAGEFKLTAKKVLMKNGQPVLDDKGDYIFIGERELAEFPNLILDSGLERIGQGEAISGCCVGSGNSTPSVDKTALDSIVAVRSGMLSSSQSRNSTVAPYYSKGTFLFRFDAGKAAGNLSQIAIGWGGNETAKTMGGLWCMSLIKDSNGNPTTITVLSDEVLDVYYSLSLYPPTGDTVGTVKFGSETYNYKMRASNIHTTWNAVNLKNVLKSFDSWQVYSGAIGEVGQLPSGNNTGAYYRYDSMSYDPNTLTASTKFTLSLDNNIPGNTPIRSIYVGYHAPGAGIYAFQVELSNVLDGSGIPKDNTKIMTMNFSITWGRYAA